MVKTVEVVYYKHVVVINHARCDIVCLETLANIGNIGNLEIDIKYPKININMFACESFELLVVIEKEMM